MDFIRQIDDTTREVYRFTKIDDNVCLTYFAMETLETKSVAGHRWRCDGWWDNYYYYESTIDEPEVPDYIAEEALLAFRQKLRVIRYSERYKRP